MSKLQKQGKGRTSAMLYVPRAIADVIPEGAEFKAELTDDGVLFRFIGFNGVPPLSEVPDWTREATK